MGKRTTYDIINSSQLIFVFIAFVSYLTRLDNFVTCDYWPQRVNVTQEKQTELYVSMKIIGESTGGVEISKCILGLLFPSKTCSNKDTVAKLKQQNGAILADMKALDEFDYRRDYLIMSRSKSTVLITDIQLVLCELGGGTSCMFFIVKFDTGSELTESDFCFTLEGDHCSDKTKDASSDISQTRLSAENLFIRFVPSHTALPNVESTSQLKQWMTRRSSRIWPEAINEREKCFSYGTCRGFTDHTKHYLMAIGVIGAIFCCGAIGLVGVNFKFTRTINSPKSQRNYSLFVLGSTSAIIIIFLTVNIIQTQVPDINLYTDSFCS